VLRLYGTAPYFRNEQSPLDRFLKHSCHLDYVACIQKQRAYTHDLTDSHNELTQRTHTDLGTHTHASSCDTTHTRQDYYVQQQVVAGLL
jgi:hypothetical protein